MPREVLVHLHIPKCSGTTCHEYFVKQYSKVAIFDCKGKREHGSVFTPITVDSPVTSDFVQRVQEGHPSVIMGHLPYGIHRYVNTTRSDSMLYFCVLRHPVHRVWSLYHHQRRNSVYKLYSYLEKHNGDLKETLLHTPPTELLECYNDQMRMVLGSGKFEFDESDFKEVVRLIEKEYFYVTVIEQLEERKLEIKKLFGFEEASPWPNNNIGRQPGGYMDDPYPDLWREILERNYWDFRLYHHVIGRGGLVGKACKEIQNEN